MSARPRAEYVRGFVAEEADVCILLRSGLGKKTLMIRWDLANDEFTLGQWLIAWVDHASVSSDGRLLTYHAHKPIDCTKRFQISTYNVVCRPPHFTALAFWNDSSGAERLWWSKGTADHPIRKPDKGAAPDSYRARLEFRSEVNYPFGYRDRLPRSFPTCSAGELVLYQEARQPYFYSLNDEPFEVDWADVDHRGRLLFARGGRVFVGDAEGERELIDLNPLEFQEVIPPRWARGWP